MCKWRITQNVSGETNIQTYILYLEDEEANFSDFQIYVWTKLVDVHRFYLHFVWSYSSEGLCGHCVVGFFLAGQIRFAVRSKFAKFIFSQEPIT